MINKLIIVNNNIKHINKNIKFCNKIGLIIEIKKFETGFIMYNILINNQKIHLFRSDFEFIE